MPSIPARARPGPPSRGHPRRRPRGRDRGARGVRAGDLRDPQRRAAFLRARRGAPARGGRRDRRASPAPRPACPRGACAASSSAPPASSRPSPPWSTPATTSTRSSTRADPDAKPIPRPDVRRMLVPDRSGGRLRRQQLPARLLDRRRRHRVSALAAGCPVIVKGHPSHPGTSAVGRARARGAPRAEAGLPGGAFALLQSSGIEVGEALVDEPAIAAVGFTGSLAGGRALYDRAARARPADPGLRRDGQRQPDRRHRGRAGRARRGDRRAGSPASVSSFGGQLCTKPGVVFVPAGEAGEPSRRPRRAPGRRRAAGAAQRAPARRAATASRWPSSRRLAERGRRRRRRRPSPGFRFAPRPTARRRPTCARTPSCSRSASARSCCC